MARPKLSKGIRNGNVTGRDIESSVSIKDDGDPSKVDHRAVGHISRAQILEWMVYGAAPLAMAESVATVYAQQPSRCSPPPLPPRIDDVATSSSSPARPSIKTTSDYEILIVDQFNDYASLMAQCHLERLRTWTANNDGPWLFHRVDSAGLNIRTPWRVSSGGKLDDNDALLRNPDGTQIEVALRFIAEEPLFLKTIDRPFEGNQIIDRIRTHCVQGLDAKVFAQYDYLVACDQRTFEALHTLSNRVLNQDWSSSRSKMMPPRICLLETAATQRNKDADMLASPIHWAIFDFARRELGWEVPTRGITDGGLRTSFLQIQLEVQKHRVSGKQGENLRKIEERTECKLHVARQSPSYGWVVAIVGPKRRLWEAEALVKELRSGEKIEW